MICVFYEWITQKTLENNNEFGGSSHFTDDFRAMEAMTS